jgi:hypothetical protein
MAVTTRRSDLPPGWRLIKARSGLLTTTFYISPTGRRYSSLIEVHRHIAAAREAASSSQSEDGR